MRHPDRWVPTKFVYERGKLVASRDPVEVGVGSRLIANLVASLYDRHLRTHARGHLLDLGCGKVPLHEAYRPFIQSSTCVDWQNTLHPNDLLDHECDLTQQLIFEDNSFDTIILSDVLEHIPRPMFLWSEMGRVLRPGGKILLNVPFYYWLHETPHDYYRFTEYALRRFAHASGFTTVVLVPVGGAPEIVADITAKNLVRFLPRTGGHLAAAVQYATRVLLKAHVVKRLSELTGKRSPLGYFMVAEKNGSDRAGDPPNPSP
ncbi:MAG: methyltransferase domain-containing protein [Acidobacteriota bacterium]